MDIRLSEAGHVIAVRWRFAVCSIGHGSSSPGCASIDAWSNHLSPVRARMRRCRARVQSARITRSGHTQRTNERARESALPATRRTGQSWIECTHVCHVPVTYTCTRVRVCMPPPHTAGTSVKFQRVDGWSPRDGKTTSPDPSYFLRPTVGLPFPVHWCDQARTQLLHVARTSPDPGFSRNYL